MFEKYIVNGIEHTRAELERAAEVQEVNFETLISKLNAQVVKRDPTMDDIELNSKFITSPEYDEPRIKSWGGIVDLEQVNETPIEGAVKNVVDKISRFAEGTVSIVDNLTKGYETGEYGFVGEVIAENVFLSTLGYISANLREKGYEIPKNIGIIDLTSPRERRSMYEAHLIESAKKGLTLQEAQKLDPTNRIKLEGVLEWFDKYQYDVELDKDGKPLDFIELYSKGDIAGGSDALVQDVFSAAPSVIISRIPYGIGPAILGAGAYMENFERELYERLDEEVKESADLSYKNVGDKISRGDVITNSVIHGSSDFLMEFFGGRLLNSIGKNIPKEQAKDILINSTGTFFKTIAKGFGYEALTEGATGILQEAADALTYGDLKSFSNLGRTFIKDGIIGGILGGKSATLSAKNILDTRKRQEWFATKEWKQKNGKLENDLIETQKSYAKSTTDSEKSNFKNKIKEILAEKKKHREDLYDFFDNLDSETLLAYAKNYDKAEQALDIIGNNKYTKEEQDKAFKELLVINKKAEQFFDNTKIEYNSARQTGISLAFKALEAIRKQKGAIGTSNRNARLTYMNKAKADKLIAENKDLKNIFYDEKGNYSVQGVFINKAKDGKFDIYIDEINAANVESTNVVGHENFHGIISFNFKKGIGRENLIKATKTLVKYLKENGYGQVVDDINKRLAVKYNAITANGQILVDENGIVLFDKKNEKNYEEYFTILSDIVDTQKLKAGDKDVSNLVSSWNALMYGFGFKKIDFQNAESVLNFVKTYSKNIKNDNLFGKLKAKLVSRAKAKGLEAKDKKDIISKPGVKKSITPSRQYTPKQRDTEMNEAGEKYTRQEWIDGKGEEVYWDMWSKGYIEDMVREQMSDDLKGLPGFSEADFINETAIKLKKAFEDFNINRKQTAEGKFGLAGWIGQNISWKLSKVLRDGLATKQKFEESLSDEIVANRVQQTISEDQDQTSFDEVDLLQEEINTIFNKEQDLRDKRKPSVLRSKLKNRDNEGLPDALVQKFRDIVADIIANEPLKPGNTKQNRAFIKSIEDKVYKKLRKDIQDFIQVGDYTQNIYDNALLIQKELKTKELVAIEKKLPSDERILTKYVGRLTRKADIQRAIDLDLLPPEAIDLYKSGVPLRVKIQPETEIDIANFSEALRKFYNPPTFVRSKKDPNKTVRSGLRGTRRDAISGYLAKNIAEDAIPEALKDPKVIKGRTDITKELFDEIEAAEITRAINKSIDHKFSKSAGRDIDNAIDGGDLSPFVHIKFSKKLRREFNSRLRAKRPDEVDEYYDDQIDQVFKYTDDLDESVYNRNKMQKLAFHYLINGAVILPEDGYKVTEAADLAQKNKVDPFSYKNPEDLINQFKKLTADKTLLDPETLPTFSNRQEFAGGRIVIYNVKDTKEGQIDLRKLADSHFGKSFNNWCLCARLGEYYSSDQAYSEQERDQMIAEQEAVGRSVQVEEYIEDGKVVYELTIMDKKDPKDELKASFRHWQDYKGDLGFKAVFIDGKLKYFRSGNEGKYYDIKDEEHSIITYKDTKVDKDGFRKVYDFDYTQFQKDQDESENLIKTDSYIYTAFYEKGSKNKKSGEYIKQSDVRRVIERHFKNKNGEFDGERIVIQTYDEKETIVYKKGKKVKATKIETVAEFTEDSKVITEILPSKLGGGLVEVMGSKTTVVKNYDKNGVLINVQRVLEGVLKPVALRNILSGAISDMVPGANRGELLGRAQDATIRQSVDYNKKFVKGGKRIKLTFTYDIDQITEIPIQDSSEYFIESIDASSMEEAKEIAAREEAKGYVTRIDNFGPNDISVVVMEKVETFGFSEKSIEFKTAVSFGQPEFGKLKDGEYERIDKAKNEFTLKNAKYEIEGENTVSVKINAANQTLKNAEETVGPRIENVKFSRGMSERLNEMLERIAKVPADKIFSRADAKVAKRPIIKGKMFGFSTGITPFYLPPGAEDFKGLLYSMLGKGKKGDQDFEFFQENLLRPFSKANINLNTARMKILADFDKLKLRWKEVTKKLNSKLPGINFTNDMAIRVYLFDKMGEAVPGLTVEQQQNLVDRVKTDRMLLGFAENLQAILNVDGGYLTPSENWTAESVTSDVYKVTEQLNRAVFLKDWIENKNEIFNEDNLNKIQVIYGKNYRDALEDMLFSMEKGKSTNRNNVDKETNFAYRWLQGTVGTIMFFNMRSAVTQLISTVNYINYKDNNPIQALRALCDVKQFSKDFAMIFNSQYLKDRRGGLKTDVQHGEIAQALRGIKSLQEIINDVKNGDNTSAELAVDSIKSIISYLLKIGFTPTQIADSTAISFGGATFYRNRVNTYLKQGLDQKQAEDKAFNDMVESSEESQQSAREDKISRQQKSLFGRLILQFQNYPLQQNRIIKRAFQDLINKRGDIKTHISRLAFYGFAQNLLFYTIQQALFALPFFDDDDEEVKEELLDTKGKRILNGILDTFLRGSGIAGGIISTAKNALIKLYETQVGQGDGLDFIVELSNISPGIGGKGRQFEKIYRTIDYNKEAPLAMNALHPKNPIIQVTASTLEATLNLPADRILKKINNLVEITDTSRNNFERSLLFLGYSPYDMGITDVYDEVKQATKEGKKMIKEFDPNNEDNTLMLRFLKTIHDEEKETRRKKKDKIKSTSKKCKGITSKGRFCEKNAQEGSDFCVYHQ